MNTAYLDQSNAVELKNPTFRAVVERGAFEKIPQYLSEENLGSCQVVVVTDKNVHRLYGKRINTIFTKANMRVITIEIDAGEQHKTFAQAAALIEKLSDANINRSDTIIALGGGVVGDLVGFVASIYNRGVSLVHVPTTLLAMVDSSIGGKTGVDHGGKNKTGTFFQPRLVIADPNFLATLNDQIYTEGFGEIAKYAVLDAKFLRELENMAQLITSYSEENLDTLGHIIAACVGMKSAITTSDSHEQASDGRILLNYGHTFAHGIEAAGGYVELLHGEAVAIGMNFAARLALELELTDEKFVARQKALLESLGLPVRYLGSASAEDVIKHMAKDKKNTNSESVRFVLPRDFGELSVEQIPFKTLEEFVYRYLNE